MKSMDFKNICRICLESNQELFDIYTSYYTKKKLLYCEILTNCTKLNPSEEDGLPRLICKDCRHQLKRTYIFNKKCQNGDKVLRTYLKNLLKLPPQTDDVIDTNTINIDIKKEEVKGTNSDLTLKENRVECGVKIEHTSVDEDGDGWNADDNVILEDIKLEKMLTEEKNGEDQDKISWDADNDNTVLGDIKVDKKIAESAQDGSKDGKTAEDKIEKKKKPRKALSAVHQCDECGKVLSTRSNLKAHQLCHTGLRPYRCDDCPATFRGYSALFQHRKVHSRACSYHCEYCSKPFRRRTGLVNHIRAHTGEKLYNCSICFKKFVQKAQLTTHIKRHKGDKSFLCQDCGKGFPVKSDLTVHQRTHSGEKPYPCRLCDKSFATSGNLAIHVRIHNKEVKYSCAECARGFVTYSSYSVHVKRHKGQRDHRCECGKTFYTSSALKQHRVVHTGLRRYQCRVCERRFAQPSHLTRHYRRDHAPRDAPLPPPALYRRVLPDEPAP